MHCVTLTCIFLTVVVRLWYCYESFDGCYNCHKNMDFEKFVKIGESLGLEGKELLQFAKEKSRSASTLTS